MTAGVAEIGRRVIGRVSDRLQSLPILALSVHSACNCRCVMCDIWKANAEKREITIGDLERHVADIRRLRVQRVMLTGGEPLLHSNLWSLCDRLREAGIQITLVTTGVLIDKHAADIARTIDHVVISIDGPPGVHDEIRRVRGGFDRIERGVQALRQQSAGVRTTARSVVQKANHTRLLETVHAVHGIGIEQLSFLAADLTSSAFNRPEPWSPARQAEIALSRDDLLAFAGAISEVEERFGEMTASGFLIGGAASLWRIYDYYCAVAGIRDYPPVRCNAPWVSAVLEPDGQVRPCFFHPAYPSDGVDLEGTINSPSARAFRRALDVRTNETCRRCVCTLSIPYWQSV